MKILIFDEIGEIRNSGFVAKFLMKFALFGKLKNFKHFWRQNLAEIYRKH